MIISFSFFEMLFQFSKKSFPYQILYYPGRVTRPRPQMFYAQVFALSVERFEQNAFDAWNPLRRIQENSKRVYFEFIYVSPFLSLSSYQLITLSVDNLSSSTRTSHVHWLKSTGIICARRAA